MTQAYSYTSRGEGEILDNRFVIRKRLGVGGFGAVYLAEQRVFDTQLRSIALKLFREEMVTKNNATEVLNDAIMLIQLQQEQTHAEIARYLVTVFDAGFLHERPSQAFLAMEYVEGYPLADGSAIPTLAGLIHAFRPVPVDLALRWIIQILKPLAWMHTLPRPALHCDLKPENILACGKDRLKLADFGLAQLVFGISGVGGTGGTMAYQAPETLANVYPTPAADVYGMGVIMYEILAGKNPLTEVGMEDAISGRTEALRQHQIQARIDGLPPLLDYAPENSDIKYHPVLVEIIQRCLRLDANERYANAAHLLRELERYAVGEKVTVLPEATRPGPEVTISTSPTLERLLNEIEVHFQKKQYAEVQLLCQGIKEQYPKTGKPYCWLAQVHLAEKRWKEALQVCADGRKVAPEEPELFEVIACAYDMGGQLNASAQMRKQAAALRQKARGK